MSTRPAATITPNVSSVVPLLRVTDMSRSLRFYTKGLGFTLKNKWVVDGQTRWCWLDLGGSSLMVEAYLPSHIPKAKLGEGLSLCFQCLDSITLFRQFLSRGLAPHEPFVGNGLWDTAITDPDGYCLHFESPTTVPEETKLSDLPPQPIL
jgi:lactoylglutathione lyase